MTELQTQPTISSKVLLSLYNDLSAEREVFDRGLEQFGVMIQELQDFHGVISLHSFVRLFEWLANELNDPFLGLRISQRSGPDALGAVGYLFLSSGKLETALLSLVRYLEAIQSSSTMELRYFDRFVQVHYRIVDDTIGPRRQDSEYSIGLIWRYINLLSDGQIRLVQVRLEHEPPAGMQREYRRVFRAPVLFGQASNALTLPLEDVQKWREGLDPHLFPILEEHITTTLNHSTTAESFTDSVTGLLTESVLQQGARARLVADIMKISVATLHRRLNNEGSRLKQLVDSRCKELAGRLLRHSNLPVATISRRVGYAEPAVFNRAFRRWYSMTPGEFRHQEE